MTDEDDELQTMEDSFTAAEKNYRDVIVRIMNRDTRTPQNNLFSNKERIKPSLRPSLIDRACSKSKLISSTPMVSNRQTRFIVDEKDVSSIDPSLTEKNQVTSPHRTQSLNSSKNQDKESVSSVPSNGVESWPEERNNGQNSSKLLQLRSVRVSVEKLIMPNEKLASRSVEVDNVIEKNDQETRFVKNNVRVQQSQSSSKVTSRLRVTRNSTSFDIENFFDKVSQETRLTKNNSKVKQTQAGPSRKQTSRLRVSRKSSLDIESVIGSIDSSVYKKGTFGTSYKKESKISEIDFNRPWRAPSGLKEMSNGSPLVMNDSSDESLDDTFRPKMKKKRSVFTNKRKTNVKNAERCIKKTTKTIMHEPKRSQNYDEFVDEGISSNDSFIKQPSQQTYKKTQNSKRNKVDNAERVPEIFNTDQNGSSCSLSNVVLKTSRNRVETSVSTEIQNLDVENVEKVNTSNMVTKSSAKKGKRPTNEEDSDLVPVLENRQDECAMTSKHSNNQFQPRICEDNLEEDLQNEYILARVQAQVDAMMVNLVPLEHVLSDIPSDEAQNVSSAKPPTTSLRKTKNKKPEKRKPRSRNENQTAASKDQTPKKVQPEEVDAADVDVPPRVSPICEEQNVPSAKQPTTSTQKTKKKTAASRKRSKNETRTVASKVSLPDGLRRSGRERRQYVKPAPGVLVCKSEFEYNRHQKYLKTCNTSTLVSTKRGVSVTSKKNVTSKSLYRNENDQPEHEVPEVPQLPELPEDFELPSTSSSKNRVRSGRITKKQNKTNSLKVPSVSLLAISNELDEVPELNDKIERLKCICPHPDKLKYKPLNGMKGVESVIASSSLGFLKIAPGCVKKKQAAVHHDFTFLVLKGQVRLGVDDKEGVCTQFESFHIARGGQYFLKNVSDTEPLLLCFTKIPK